MSSMLVFGFKMKLRFRIRYLYRRLRRSTARFCLYKRKLVSGIVSLNLVSFSRIIINCFRSKGIDVSYLICKCGFLECHVTCIDTTPGFFLWVSGISKFTNHVVPRIYTRKQCKKQPSEMMYAVANTDGDCISLAPTSNLIGSMLNLSLKNVVIYCDRFFFFVSLPLKYSDIIRHISGLIGITCFFKHISICQWGLALIDASYQMNWNNNENNI